LGLAKGRWFLAVAVVFALLVGLAWLQQTDRVLARLESTFRFEAETSLAGRWGIWRDSLPMITEHPIMGFGLNTYGWAFPGYRQVPTSNFAMHTHNEYLEMLIETGIVGAAICLWFVIVLFKLGWSRLTTARDPWEYGVRLGAVSGWAGILVYSLTDFPTIIPAIDYVLAVLAALATMTIKEASTT
jgi:O-antigen ligase